MGNELLIRNIFFWSAQQLVSVKHVALPQLWQGSFTALLPVCWQESLPIAEPLNQLTWKITRSLEKYFQLVKQQCLWIWSSTVKKWRVADKDASFSQSRYSPCSYLHPAGILLLAFGHLAAPRPPGDTRLPSTPRDAGTGGYRAALLTMGPSLACDLVLPGPPLVVFSWPCIHYSHVGARLVEMSRSCNSASVCNRQQHHLMP